MWRMGLAVLLRAAAFGAVWLAWPDPPGGVPDSGGTDVTPFVATAIVAFLWGVLDGLLARQGGSRAFVTWFLAAATSAVLLPGLGTLAPGSWPAGVDAVRWFGVLVVVLCAVIALPAGLGVALGLGIGEIGGRRSDRR